MISPQFVETSVTKNSTFQNYPHTYDRWSHNKSVLQATDVVKQFYFCALYIVAIQACSIATITTIRSPESAATSRLFIH